MLKDIIEGQCQEMGLDLLALEIMPDHLHLFVGASPTHQPCKIVKQLKGNTSLQLRRCFKELQYLGYPQKWKRFKHLWAIGYYCGSAGHVSQDAVKRYIHEQQGKDVFDYHIFGGQQKVGAFSQTRVGDF